MPRGPTASSASTNAYDDDLAIVRGRGPSVHLTLQTGADLEELAEQLRARATRGWP